MHFQIYVPGQPDLAKSLVDVGLAHLATEFDVRPIQGPDGGPGALFGWVKPQSKEWGYQPERQTWTPAAAAGDLAAGRYWVGLWNGLPPTPAQLARRYQLPGSRQPLGDGHDWLIPRAEYLPQTMQLADDGSLKFEVQRKYHEFTLAADHWRTFLEKCDPDDPDGNEVEYDDLWGFALQALLINYRITPEVMSALELFDTNTIAGPMFIVVGAMAAAETQARGGATP